MPQPPVVETPLITRSEDERLLRMVSDAAHEVVGPVNQVSSLVALFVRRYRGQLDSEAANLLGHIESAGNKLATTAGGLRNYYQLIRSKYQPARVDTSATVQSALRALENEIAESQAEIAVGPLPDVFGDANLLSLLFQTVIQNSLKFRRPEARLQIVISGHRLSHTCQLSVADNGIGIHQEYAEKVFVAFSKLNGHAFPGAGLGLTTARAIVEMHDGRIWIEPPAAEGTVVAFEIPAPTA